MTPENAKLAWKIMRDISVKKLSEVYGILNVHMPIEAYKGESTYAGKIQPDGTSIAPMLAKTVADLFDVIKSSSPCAKENGVVWTQGNGVPSYAYSEPYHCFRKTPTVKIGHRTFTGKLHTDGKYGLGVTYAVACKLWGQNTVDKLPEILP